MRATERHHWDRKEGGGLDWWAFRSWGLLGCTVEAGCDGYLSFSPGIHVGVTLAHIIYLNIVADQVHPFMLIIFHHGRGLFQHNAYFHTKKKQFNYSLRNIEKEVRVLARPPNPQILIWSSIFGMTNKSDPWKADLTGFTGSCANVLVPDITEHCQKCCGVHASTYQTVLEAQWGLI